jgi:hypothetical protein
MPLMLGTADPAGKGAGVSLVHNDKFWAGAKKVIPAMVRLDVVQGDDREGEMIEEALATSAIGFQTASCTRQDQLGIDLEFVLQFPLPLFCKVRGAEHGHARNFAAVQQLLGEEGRLDRLSNTHIIGNEEAHGVLFEPHEQGDQLVRTRLEVQVPERSKRSSTSAKTKSQRISKHTGGTVIPCLLWDGVLELCGADLFETAEDAGDLHVSAAQGTKHGHLF